MRPRLSWNEQQIIRQILQHEFDKIRRKNPAYSQRAFAKKLGIHSGTLSSFLQNKRTISAKISQEILQKVNIDEDIKKWITQTLRSKKKNKAIEIERTLLDLDRFAIISDPIHLNALNLLRTSNAEPNIPWLAKKLKKSDADTQSIVERIIRAGLATLKDEKIIPNKKPIKTPDNFPHKAIRAFHKNSLIEAMQAIEEVPVEDRDFSAITITADPAKMNEVRELIKNFRDQVGLLLGSAPGSEVYKLSVQFYPIAYEKIKTQ